MNTQEINSSQTQKALLAVKAMKQKLEDVQKRKTEPLAVIGMSCRLPGGINSPEEFWQLLVEKKDAITDIPKDRWNLQDYFDEDPAEPGKLYVKQGGFVEGPYQFDPELFGLSKRESISMDPQQRLLLELSWEALERAGIAPRKAESRHNTGLFIGMATNDYARFHMHSADTCDIDVYSFTGCAPSIASGRISQLLDLGGPTLTLDTACSSSIVALHLARQSILNDECEVALVGGVNLILTPENTVYFCKTSALSPDSRCHTFDEKANGYVRSEGAGVIVLKRLSQAIADKDNILAVMLGSAINHDGEGIGLTAPNGDSQQRLVEKALKVSGVNPQEISYIETHGTGTPLGDPIELQALGRVFSSRKDAIAIGSCKSNIGHTEAAAGVTGIIKTILCLQHKKLAPNLHFNQPSSFIPWDKLPLRVVKDVEDWQPISGKRIAGVSSFGFSGTNSHAIFTEAPVTSANTVESIIEASAQILVLSGKTPKRLQSMVKKSLDYVKSNRDASLHNKVSLNDFCYAMNRGRHHFANRLVIHCNSFQDLEQKLVEWLQKNTAGAVNTIPTEKLPLAIELRQSAAAMENVFSWLKQHNPYFKKLVEDIAVLFHAHGLLTPEADQSDASYLAEFQKYPELFCHYYAWIKWTGDLLGPISYLSVDSTGALAAACYAEEITLEDAVELCAMFVKGKHVDVQTKTRHSAKTAYMVNGQYEFKERNFDDWYKILTEPVKSEILQNSFASKSTLLIMNASPTAFGALPHKEIHLPALTQSMDSFVNQLIGFCLDEAYEINWKSFYYGQDFHFIPVPVMAFDRDEYRLETPFTKNTGVEKSDNRKSVNGESFNDKPINHQKLVVDKSGHPLLGKRIFIPQSSSIIYQQSIKPGQVPFLLDHGFLKKVVVPATAYLETIHAAIKSAGLAGNIQLEEVIYHAGLYLPEDDVIYTQVVLSGPDFNQVELLSAPESKLLADVNCDWTLHCSAKISRSDETIPAFSDKSILASLNANPVTESFYIDLNEYGYLFGPAHQGVTHLLHPDQKTCFALVELAASVTTELDQYFFHPAHLDSCCHSILTLLDKTNPDSIFITIGKDQVRMLQAAEKTVLVKATLTEKTDFSVKADMEIYNLQGQCLAYVKGYTMKAVTRHLLNPDVAQKSESIKIDTDVQKLDTQKTDSQKFDTKKIADWIYVNQWQETALDKSVSLHQVHWLIVERESVQNSGLAETLVQVIKDAGSTSQVVNKSEIASIHNIVQSAAKKTGVIYLAADYGRLDESTDSALINQSSESRYFELTEILNAIPMMDNPVNLFVLTKGSVFVDQSEPYLDLTGSVLWGAGRSILLERPDIRFANIDLDPMFPIENGESLKAILTDTYPQEDQFAIRDGKIWINRLQKQNSEIHVSDTDLQLDFTQNFKLAIDEQGTIDNLYFKPVIAEELNDDEVEIETAAAALNLSDVVTALDLLNTSIANSKGNNECRFGVDTVGRISRMGKAVTAYQIGDWVMGFAPGCLAKHVKVHHQCIVHKPDNFSVYESATIPTSFLTAYYALMTLAKLKKGDKVLIHAAAGGVGIAAINLANIIGAEVYATASHAKWPLLKSLGVKHIYNSRTLDFADEILRDTKGEGVDLVLNSLIGEYIQKNVDVLKTNGRFVEIGEREILTAEQVKSFGKPFSYYSFTLFDISRDHPEQISSMFHEMIPLWKSRDFTGIPYQLFQAKHVKNALRMMQQGLHKGKLVIALEDLKATARKESIKNSPAILITGGMGGIGWACAQWLVNSSVKNIFLMGRNPLNADIESKMQSLAKNGKHIEYFSGDVARFEDVENIIQKIADKGIELNGILHTAGIMKNALIADETQDDAKAVFAAKVSGTWNLHQATKDMSLDFFACFSSMTSLIGAAGAASYAAGNKFIDNLVAYRRSLGLNAQAINWCAWEEVGMLTRLNEAAQDYWRENGMRALPNEIALDIFEKLSATTATNIAVLPADWAIWNRQYERLPSALIGLEATAASPATIQVSTAQESKNQNDDVYLLVSNSIRKVLRLASSTTLNDHTSFKEMGIDSLMSVELRNILSKALGIKLSSTLLYNYSNIHSLAEYLATETGNQKPVVAPVEIKATVAKPAIDTKALLKEQLKTLLRLKADTVIDEQESFKNMGIDSLMSVELRNKLSKALGIKLSSTLLFNYTTVSLLAEHLHSLVNPGETKATEPAPAPQVVKAVEEKLVAAEPVKANEELSIEQLRSLLDEKLMEEIE